VLALVAVLVLGAGALLVAGVATGTGATALAGAQLLLGGLIGLAAMVPTRAVPPPATAVDGGLRLPLRRGYAVRLGALWVVLASAMVTAALLDGRGELLLVGVGAVLLALAAAGWFVTRGAEREQVVLDPGGITVAASQTGTTRLAWTALKGAQPVARLRPLMVLIPRGNRAETMTFPLLPQAWSAEALTEIIEHYVDHPADRAELVSPDALDRFRR
jgi:hypothetical protein